jgi:NAD-dependent SIR2 family protein deacetylase
MEKRMTECVTCGKEIAWDQNVFVEGEHGEPVCSDCKEEK